MTFTGLARENGFRCLIVSSSPRSGLAIEGAPGFPPHLGLAASISKTNDAHDTDSVSVPMTSRHVGLFSPSRLYLNRVDSGMRLPPFIVQRSSTTNPTPPP